jgi:hypothetical protein
MKRIITDGFLCLALCLGSISRQTVPDKAEHHYDAPRRTIIVDGDTSD